jgi:hypothetical protein
MAAGAGQILLKSAGMVPDGRLLLAGSGPLILLLAYQYLQAGVKIDALIDTTPQGAMSRSFGKLFGALPAADYLFKGLKMMLAIRRAGIPVYHHVEGLSAVGGEKLETVRFDSGKAGFKKLTNYELPADTLLLHQSTGTQGRKTGPSRRMNGDAVATPTFTWLAMAAESPGPRCRRCRVDLQVCIQRFNWGR